MAVDRSIHAQVGFPQRCIFCGAADELTAEDWWPRWLTRYLPSPFDAQRRTTTSTLATDFKTNHLGVIAPAWKARGALYSPLKVVCRECNNDWMSGLQHRASGYLKPLVSGEWQQLDTDAQLAIAAWMTMLTMVYDFYDMNTQNVTALERTTFKETLTPPSNWIVSLGSLRRNSIHGRTWKRSFGLHPPSEIGAVSVFNGQTTLLLQVLCFCIPTLRQPR